MKLLALIGLAAAVFTVGCTTQRTVTNNYLQQVNDTVIRDSAMRFSPVIQKNDLISIRVYSQALGTMREREVEGPYNLVETSGAPASFQVDLNGDIEYPKIGRLHVEGMTREMLQEEIRKRLEGALTNPAVTVRFINYKVTVLGEVERPSTFTLPTEHVTILEALGMAGDVTEFGRRDNVKIYRENNGERQIGTIDLTSSAMFNSPYFRLQQNDVIFIDQTERRIRERDQQALAQQIGITTSIITAVALILNIIIRR